MIFFQHFSDLGIRIVEITKDNSLALSASLDTGWLLALSYTFITKITFFNDTPHSSGVYMIRVLHKLFRITPVETPAAIRAGGHTKTTADTTMVVHHYDAIFIFESRFGGASPDTGGLIAMVTEYGKLMFCSSSIPVLVAALGEGILKICHPYPFDLVFLIRKLRNIMDGMTG